MSELKRFFYGKIEGHWTGEWRDTYEDALDDLDHQLSEFPEDDSICGEIKEIFTKGR